MQLGATSEKLKTLGVETLAIVASDPGRARLYFRFRPSRFRVGADPYLQTHRAYGIPWADWTDELRETLRSKYAQLARDLGVDAAEGEYLGAPIDRAQGFDRTASDWVEGKRHKFQFVGTFLVDREGVIRWVSIEGEREGLAGLEKFPTEERLLAAARGLLG